YTQRDRNLQSSICNRHCALPARLPLPTLVPPSRAALVGWWPFRFRPRFVDDQRTALEWLSVELGHGFLRACFVDHVDKREPARAARGHVAHHSYAFDGSRLAEQRIQVLVVRLVREIPHIQSPAHRRTAPCNARA